MIRTISEAIIANPTAEPFSATAPTQATILGAASSNGVLFIAFLSEQVEEVERRTFSLVGPGGTVPDRSLFVCSVHDPPFMSHLFEVAP